MTRFVIDQTAREALSAERAASLLSALDVGVESVKLSGKSFGDGSAEEAAAALHRAAPTLVHLDISDIIASRPEQEAKRALATIADSLAACKTLQYIDLSDNALGAKGIRAVGGLLGGQTELRTLLLCNNGLAADAGKLIAANLLRDGETALEKLHFHNNLLENAGALALAPVVQGSPRLQDFRFSSLRLGRDGTVCICKALHERVATTLRHLNLSDNTFGDEGAAALIAAVQYAPALETLLLRDAALGDEGVEWICEALATGAGRLRVLDMSGNEVATKGAEGVAKVMRLGELREVYVEDNELGNIGAERMAWGVREGLQVLEMGGSEIGGMGAMAIAEAARKVPGLRVGINGNVIPEEVVRRVEEMLGDRVGSFSDNDEEGEEEEGESESESASESEREEDDEEKERGTGGRREEEENRGPENGVAVKGVEKKEDTDVDELTAKIEQIAM